MNTRGRQREEEERANGSGIAVWVGEGERAGCLDPRADLWIGERAGRDGKARGEDMPRR